MPQAWPQGIEDLLVQELVAQAAIEAFYEGVLLRLARVNVMPGHPVLVGPLQDGAAGELGAVVADDASGLLIVVFSLVFVLLTKPRVASTYISKNDLPREGNLSYVVRPLSMRSPARPAKPVRISGRPAGSGTGAMGDQIA